MKALRSLQARLAILIGIGVTLLWILAASVTASMLRHEMDEVFDSTLQETAQRLLPLAVIDIIEREEEGLSQRISNLTEESEFLTYVVRDKHGRVLISSHSADPSIFPAYNGNGFRQSATHRFYYDAALRNSITIAVAEPLAHRASIAHEMQLGLGLPLLVVIPLCLAVIFGAVRLSFKPVRQFGDALASRGAHDLSPTPNLELPSELAPIAVATDELLLRLKAAFEAERNLAANAAHELRTPVAGAIAQVQRLQSETSDPVAANRAADIEKSLKRLTRVSEKLIQLARAEGGRLRTGKPADLRQVLGLIVSDFERSSAAGRIEFLPPKDPVMSDMDPDAFAIVCRNLIENALKHGLPGSPVRIVLSPSGRLSVSNDGPVIAPDLLKRLTRRFERGSGGADGSGLGLAIVRTIAERADCAFTLASPIAGQQQGIEVVIDLPMANPQ